LGADIINSSLSYKLFDDPAMNHDSLEMDGKTAISSIAATMAVERGIFVCNSAGNSNNTLSPWVGSPADVLEVLSLGAVNLEGEIAYFSSVGPNGAGYPKPDVVACGSGAYVIRPDNAIGTASGTSFSSPITCGLVACIIGAVPSQTPDEIRKAIQKSADRYPNHDIQYGYGIPNFGKVLHSLGVSTFENKTGSKLIYYPNPVNDKLYVSNNDQMIKSVELYDVSGKLVKSINPNNHHTCVNVKEISKGFLFVKVTYENNTSEMVKCMIIR
jgi:subtilisin family serine protease